MIHFQSGVCVRFAHSFRSIIGVALGLALSSALFAGTLTLSDLNGGDGVVNVGSTPVTYTEGGFNISLVSRAPNISTHFYFSNSNGYAYGGLGNTSEMDISETLGGAFLLNSVLEWAFQGSYDAQLQLFGYNGATLVGSETFDLASPVPGSIISYGSALKLATSGGLSGIAITELVIYPNFTAGPTNQSGLANLTLTPVTGSPEPGTLSLLFLGGVGLLVLRKP